MKHLLLPLCVFTWSSFIKAQEPVFAWSRAESKPSTQVDVKILGYDGQGYYLLTKKPPAANEFSSSLFIDYFNNKNERVFSVNITPSNQYDYVNVLYIKSRPYLFTSLFSKEAGKNVLYSTEIKPDGSRGNPVELMSMDADRLASRGRFELAASPDGSKLLVMAQPDFRKNENEKNQLSLFNSGFEKIWNTVQIFPYEWKRSVDNSVFINDQGTVFILKRTGAKNYAPVYSVFSFDGKDLKEFKIETGEKKKILSISQAFSSNGDFAVAGYYSETGNISVTIGIPSHGSYVYRIDSTGSSLIFSAVNPFEKRKDLVLKKILFHQSNIVLLGEVYWASSGSVKRDPNPYNLSTNVTQDNTYYGKDIWLDGFDEKGKPLYNTSIEKDNTSKNDNGTGVSYFGALVNGKIVVIYNDFGYKYDGKKHVAVAMPSKIPVMSYVDAQTGSLIKTIGLFNSDGVGGRSGDMLMRPDVFLRADETHYIIRAENILNYKMGIISF